MNKIAERPRYSDRETSERAVEELIPDVLKWLGGDSTAEEIREDLLDALDCHDDGYDICRILESRYSWAVNAGLVEIMEDMAAFRKHEALRERVKEWVAATGLKPEYGEGDIVTFACGDEFHEGKIKRIHTVVGTYLVFCPALGHVESGVGTNGIYVNFENVKTRAGRSGG